LYYINMTAVGWPEKVSRELGDSKLPLSDGETINGCVLRG